VLGVITVFWKLALTKQYTFLESPDLANQVMPWLEAEVYAIRHWSVLLWDPYEWAGQSLIGQVQPGVASPFTFLLALAPLHNGQIQPYYVHLWFVLMHCVAALFAYWLLRDLECTTGPAVIGGLFYATAGFCGSTEWPQQLAPGIWAPLVFLFFLRAMRGRAPLKSAAWAGVALGAAWLSGHHEPAFMITLAVLGTGAVWVLRTPRRMPALLRLAIVFAAMALVSAVQVLPAFEYGKLAKRWTETGALTWKDKVEIPEHEDLSLHPADLLHIVMPGANLRTNPFVGVVGLSLAAIAVCSGFRRREVRWFVILGICALLYSMAQNNALYGPLYVFMPMVEKSRSPIVAMSIFHFSIAVLAALGAEILFTEPNRERYSKVVKALVWFGAITFGLFTLMAYLRPTVSSSVFDGDTRPGMIGLIALLLAAVYYAWGRARLERGSALVLAGLLLIVEQSNVVGWGWVHARDAKRSVLMKALTDSRDVADFIRRQPNPKRIDVNDADNDLKFTFGDWYRIETMHAFTASMLTQTSELGGWWQDRLARMYGIKYIVSRKPMRPDQRVVFAGNNGINVFEDPAAFPRAWTVHDVVVAPNEWNGRDMVNNWTFDLRTTALTVKSRPNLEKCDGSDQVTGIDERPATVTVNVEMACTGLLIVSDNDYPGWHATVDGKPSAIWRVNTVIRGAVVDRGRHQMVMKYRPGSVYFGLFCLILGLAGAVVLQRRPEPDGLDLTGG
jgi:hypothetical protein